MPIVEQSLIASSVQRRPRYTAGRELMSQSVYIIKINITFASLKFVTF